MHKGLKICCVFNIAPLYRRGIYRLMDGERAVEFDFLFGAESREGIALLDATELEGFRGYVHNRYKKSGKLVWQRGAIRRALSKKYDGYLLTGNPGIRSNWVIMLIARLLGRKIYLWTHGLRGDERGWKRRKNRAFFRRADHLLLYGERAERLLREAGYPADRMTVIYNSLDYERQLRIRAQVPDRSAIRAYFGNEEPVVTFVGRLTAAKGLDLLLEAIVPLACNLILVGDGPMRSQLEGQAERLGLADRVWFYGESYDEQVIGTFLYHSAVCVSPGNVGLLAMHALMFGTPVVTQDDPTCQMPEWEAITRGLTGDFFERGNPVSLRETLRGWLSCSPQEREATRRAAQAVIDQKYNPARQMEAIHAALGTLFDQD